MTPIIQSRITPVILLAISNTFMTFAWYGNLKFKHVPLWLVILISWSIAFFEYVFMIPANRWGIISYSLVQLKVMQEVITLTIFSAFAILYMGTRIHWNHVIAFVLIVAAAGFTFMPQTDKNPSPNAQVSIKNLP